MKFGETLEETLFPLWRAYYFDYDALKLVLDNIKDTFPYTQLFKSHQVHIVNDPAQPFRFLISKVYFTYKNGSGQTVEAVVKVMTERRSFLMNKNRDAEAQEVDHPPPTRSKTTGPDHHDGAEPAARKSASAVGKQKANQAQKTTSMSSIEELTSKGVKLTPPPQEEETADQRQQKDTFHHGDHYESPDAEGDVPLHKEASMAFNETQPNAFDFDKLPISTISVGGASSVMSAATPSSRSPHPSVAVDKVQGGVIRSEQSIHSKVSHFRWVINEENVKPLDLSKDTFDFKPKDANYNELEMHGISSAPHGNSAEAAQQKARHYHRRLLGMRGQTANYGASHCLVTMSFSWEGKEADYYNPALAYAVYEFQRTVSLVIAPKIQAELTKISTFYIRQSHILSNAALLCIDSVKLWQDMSPTERAKLRTSYRQTYLMLQVLQQYCDLNAHAISKYSKKLDKNTFQGTLDDYAASMESASFRMGKGSRNVKLQAKMVDKYAMYVTDNRHKHALNFLESGMAEGATHKHSSMTTIVSLSFLWGVVIAVFAMVIVLLVSLDSDGELVARTPSWDPIASKYATYLILVPFMFILLPFLFSINVMVWEWFGINYAFIFELDPLFHFTGVELMRDSLIYLLAWLLCVYSYLRINLSNVFCLSDPANTYLGPSVTPLWCIFPLFIVIYITIALRNYFSDEQRTPFSAVAMWHIVTTPYHSVKFGDFFLADQLTSLLIPLFEIQFYWCTFTSATITECVVGRAVNAPFLNILPNTWRMVQSLRRYYDEPIKRRKAFPNLVNTYKYLSAVVDIIIWVLFAVARYEKASHAVYWTAFSFAFFSSTFTQMFKFGWDVIVDAGIWIRVKTEEPKDEEEEDEERPERTGKQVAYNPAAGEDSPWHWELREDRIYRAWWPYVSFFIANFVMRWMWIVRYYASINHPWSFSIFAAIEIFRRFLWSFFRMENEHVSNTENYRATKLAPIPQKDISKWDIEIDENFMADKKIKLDNFTNVTRYFSFLPDAVKARILQDGSYITGLSLGKVLQGLPNEGKSKLFSELPEEVKVLLLIDAVGDETMAGFREKLKKLDPSRQASAVKIAPPAVSKKPSFLSSSFAGKSPNRTSSSVSTKSHHNTAPVQNEPIADENGIETLNVEEV